MVLLARRTGVAAAVWALTAGAAFAGEATGRDYKFESYQVHQLCRNYSSATRNQLASLQYCLSREEFLDLIEMRSEGSCVRWIDEFWRGHDPVLTTAANEARVEHERRVEIATNKYSIKDWPGWDQRGEIFIRYGLPAAQDIEAADVTVGSYVRPSELWFYPSLGMTVQFEDAFGNGNYTYFIDHVELPIYERFSSDRLRMPAGQWKDMPDMDLDLMSLDVVLGVYGGYFGIPNPSDAFTFDDFQETLWRFPEVLESTPVVYPFDFAGMRVPMDYQVAFFRGGESVDRVDVNAEFNVEPASNKDPRAVRTYRATAVVFDKRQSEVARLTHTMNVRAPGPDDDDGTMVCQLPFTLSPASYDVAITLEDTLVGRFTSFRQSIRPDDFDSHLTISTVSFASGIEPVKKDSAFNRGALEVVPKPSARYLVATSVPVYFEVYNLSPDTDGSHPYTVSYRVIPQTPAPKGLLKKLVGSSDQATSLTSTFHASASATSDVVYLFLKTDHLWPGDFQFDVSVVDDVSHTETKRTGTFHLVE